MRTARLACISLFVAACAFASPGATQQAPAIRLAGSPAVRGAIAEVCRTFEAQTGVRVEAEYGPFTVIKRRIDGGETFDIVVLSPELIQSLVTAGTIVPETVSVGRHGVGLAARAGQAVPNIQTAGALTQALLEAQRQPGRPIGIAANRHAGLADQPPTVGRCPWVTTRGNRVPRRQRWSVRSAIGNLARRSPLRYDLTAPACSVRRGH